MLRVKTVELTEHSEKWALLGLLDRASATNPLVWLHRGEGLIGAGQVLRLTFTGPHRFRDADAAWQKLRASAEVTNPFMHVAGTGLVAFGSFAFADESESESVLLVPEVVFGQRDGFAWVTTFDTVTDLPQVRELDGTLDATFRPGSKSAEEYVASINTVRSLLREGTLDKVVLARDIVAEIDSTADLRLAVSYLAHVYSESYTFAVDRLIGASPEMLLRVRELRGSGQVLAGTAARVEDAEADARARDELLSDAKNLAEHAVAVQSALEHLRTVGLSAEADDEPFALELPNVWHLASDFSVDLTPEHSALRVVEALHPTAAVAGAPLELALRVAREHEGFDRGRYAGPVGWMDSTGNAEWAIALRCAQVGFTKVRAIAGAGVMADSDAELELAETSLKFEPIIRAFGGE